MKGIILASHGRLAEGLYDTLQMFSGKQPQVEALCLSAGEDIQEFLEKLKASIQRVDTGDGVVIFCDLLFGSPCNCSARLLSDDFYKDKISVITGMNLAMVLEYVGSREQGMEDKAIVTTGKDGIIDFKEMLAQQSA